MLFLRGLVHDIGLRLKAYAICVNIRRIRDGFMSYDDPACLALNDWNTENICASTQTVTLKAREYISKYKDSVIIGESNDDNIKSEREKNTSHQDKLNTKMVGRFRSQRSASIIPNKES